jgi:AraC-like DNA-binding protein
VTRYLLTTVEFPTSRLRTWRDEVHRRDELIWVTSGAVTVHTPSGVWDCSPGRAIWVPQGVPHTIDAAADSVVQATFFAPGAVAGAATEGAARLSLDEAVVVELLPAVRELLVLNAGRDMPDASRLRLQHLVLDLLCPATEIMVGAPMPESPRLRTVALRILSRLDAKDSTADWSELVGVSQRELVRSFVRETGVSPIQWRIRARVRASLPLLYSGIPVASTARRLGYRSAGTFSEHFRDVMGRTPGAYARNRMKTGETRPDTGAVAG